MEIKLLDCRHYPRYGYFYAAVTMDGRVFGRIDSPDLNTWHVFWNRDPISMQQIAVFQKYVQDTIPGPFSQLRKEDLYFTDLARQYRFD